MDEPIAWIKARELTYMKAVVEHGATEWKTNLGLKPEDGDVPLYTAPPQQHSEQWWRHEVSNAWAEGYEKGRASVKQPEQEPVTTLFGSLPVYDVPPKQEPVAWMYQHEDTGLTMCVVVQQVGSGFDKNNPRWQKIAPLYTAPPKILCGCGDQIMPDDGAECGNCVAARNTVKPEWVGLTDEEKKMAYALYGTMTAEGFVKSLETKLREKNT